ncbi:YitT family protein [Melissococcus plutonius]|uniref:YitT family protein n=1 Tax=Melissococcus plutonius (strain ATCC 35311 / DSM 29964 / CIP 104052 / LMG 20360 / NCIMB 702443) TaxID=940190 RepID=F3YAJ2_MELPT|nr:YitT family protein [Melissococcus plutonius]AIM24985.1 YitT family protein [Melissococcus plutonius S1]KMT25145.1 YitT family protein [Melissococcus plutonius]KMT26782.1 YitT family protein [Melissococcus plutonius]KMT28032.1 YitT family protein [Melissococcus plutonius]KMT29805.1 YitT family protein [Melissococcus plutonius]
MEPIKEKSFRIQDIIFILFGTCLYAFGIVTFNIANHLAEGGVTGITLILRALFYINPAYSTLIINIPLILIGGKILGKRSFYYTILGTVALSFFLWFWQKFPIVINLDHDLLIASLLAGLIGGLGSGVVYRFLGTTGGTDIIARILEKNLGISMGRSLLIFDVIVLSLSLTYIDVKRMMYTLIVSFVFTQIVDFVIDGSYSAKGMLIVSDHAEDIGEVIMFSLKRGVTYLQGEGGYSQIDRKILYVVVSPSEITEIKLIIHNLDEKAFISVLNVHEAIGEGFTYARPTRNYLSKKQRK